MGSYSIRKSFNEEALFLHEIDGLTKPTARILDLGAGAGSFNYGKFPSKIIAVDEEIPLSGRPRPANAFFVQCDGAALPILGNVFDIVVANFVFEHFSTPEVVLLEIERVLKPGGLLYLSIPNSSSFEDKLFRFFSGDKYHVQKFSFYSLMKRVYKSTSLKLIAFADWPAGFTWLNSPPSGHFVRRMVLHLLKLIKPSLQQYSRRDSGFIFLFRKETKLGFRLITHVCGNCGGGATIEETLLDRWKCVQCGYSHRY
ncbi:MAG: class I SAM-dependent methyltransferase [Acidobacteria bacterium]|nr:class I SAM-dependent methyltransferase [Acidobacteriota bacterium]MBI3657507.1 class I SAM-dependent methyltransferase [Acidobacteriota bacterium]